MLAADFFILSLAIFPMECTVVVGTENSHTENEGGLENDTASSDEESSEKLYLDGMVEIYRKVVSVLEDRSKLNVLISATGHGNGNEQSSILCLKSLFVLRVAESWVVRTFGSLIPLWDIFVNPAKQQDFPTVEIVPTTSRTRATDKSGEEPSEEQDGADPQRDSSETLRAVFAKRNCFILRKTQMAQDVPPNMCMAWIKGGARKKRRDQCLTKLQEICSVSFDLSLRGVGNCRGIFRTPRTRTSQDKIP
uniref:Putative secreted protein n=1 Tax=Amblyomma triste TaxID=251400 RepID=A0A023G5R9_AMBTT